MSLNDVNVGDVLINPLLRDQPCDVLSILPGPTFAVVLRDQASGRVKTVTSLAGFTKVEPAQPDDDVPF